MSIADIRPALRAFLLADATLSAAVGASRIFPVNLPQGTILPSLVFARISGMGDHHMEGPSGLAKPRIQIDAWAKSAGASHGADLASSLANLVKERIDGYKGPMSYGTSPVVTVQVQGVFFADERDDFDATVSLYRASRDYFIWYAER